MASTGGAVGKLVSAKSGMETASTIADAVSWAMAASSATEHSISATAA